MRNLSSLLDYNWSDGLTCLYLASQVEVGPKINIYLLLRVCRELDNYKVDLLVLNLNKGDAYASKVASYTTAKL